jgi:hypothetical protein
MIERRVLDDKITSPYTLIDTVLHAHPDYYLTKEEIYSKVDVDQNGVPLITISTFESALRSMSHRGAIKVAYVKGVRYFAENTERR